MSTKIAFITPAPRNRLEAEAVLGEYTLLTIEYQRQTNAMNAELASVREKYEAPLDKLLQQLKPRGDALEAWADANPGEFGKAKSLVLLHGTVGWRLGTGKLRTLGRKTWNAVLLTLKSLDLPQYIRTTEEVGKDTLIADLNSKVLDVETAKKIGVEVVKDDKFFIEPKLEGESK